MEVLEAKSPRRPGKHEDIAYIGKNPELFISSPTLFVPFEDEEIERERMRVWWRWRALRRAAPTDTTQVEEVVD